MVRSSYRVNEPAFPLLLEGNFLVLVINSVVEYGGVVGGSIWGLGSIKLIFQDLLSVILKIPNSIDISADESLSKDGEGAYCVTS